MQGLSTIFLGATPAPFRPFLLATFKHLRETGKYKRLIVPCVGNLTIPQIAVKAGWPAGNIYASDVSTYTTALVAAIKGEPLDSLGLTIEHEYWDRICKKTKVRGIEELFILMKALQLREDMQYEADYINALLEQPRKYKRSITARIEALRKELKTMRYKVADLRDELYRCHEDPEAAVYFNPPVYSKGYQKMFSFRDVIPWASAQVEEFNWKAEYDSLLQSQFRGSAPLHLWYLVAEPKPHMTKSVVCLIEKSVEKHEHIICNRPAEIPKRLKRIISRKELEMKPLDVPIFSKSDVIRPDSEVTWIHTKAEHAHYYRSLWAHRLGNTNAELYTLWFIDGKLFATCGFHLMDLFLLKTDMIFENFGFGVWHPKYTNLVRLLMNCLCTKETKDRLMALPQMRKNKLYQLNGLKTACLSLYRKVRLNTGILDITLRERLPNGMYRLMYEAPFRDKTYSDCVKEYIAEVEAKSGEAK